MPARRGHSIGNTGPENPAIEAGAKINQNKNKDKYFDEKIVILF